MARRKPKVYSYALEREYYSSGWPAEAAPYAQLGSYIKCVVEDQNLLRGRKVLEIGAGECLFSRAIADFFHPSILIATELFPQRLLPAARANSNDRLQFLAADALRLPFRDAEFDMVWGSKILSQLPSLGDVLCEVRRTLKTGGLYVGFEPNPFNPKILARYLWASHSRNQFLFVPSRVRPIFESAGLAVRFKPFFVKLPSIRNRFVGTCMAVVAEAVELQPASSFRRALK